MDQEFLGTVTGIECMGGKFSSLVLLSVNPFRAECFKSNMSSVLNFYESFTVLHSAMSFQ